MTGPSDKGALWEPRPRRKRVKEYEQTMYKTTKTAMALVGVLYSPCYGPQYKKRSIYEITSTPKRNPINIISYKLKVVCR